MNNEQPRTMTDIAAKYSISKEVQKRIKTGKVKSFLLCARKCDKTGQVYRLRYQKEEISISVYGLDGKLESARYFMDSNRSELIKLAKSYRNFKLDWIETPLIKLLAETVSN